ncbi:MAG: hypothetical protein M0Z50_00200 [Planctomycetia bacterium]|nr:hypothetical protein [Planctomycetia bacterium]
MEEAKVWAFPRSAPDGPMQEIKPAVLLLQVRGDDGSIRYFEPPAAVAVRTARRC